MKGLSIAGRKRNDGIDFYQTPEWATKALLEREDFINPILEPCSGAGAISKVLEGQNHYVVSSDIRTDDNVYGERGKSIFAIETRWPSIITNPPYFMAQKVIEQSLKLATDKVAMLLKLQFLEGISRYEFFKTTPLKRVYVFCKRITMYPEGQAKPINSGTIAYAWFVWKHDYKGSPTIEWIMPTK